MSSERARKGRDSRRGPMGSAKGGVEMTRNCVDVTEAGPGVMKETVWLVESS